jgi:hypothetical protein
MLILKTFLDSKARTYAPTNGIIVCYPFNGNGIADSKM